MGDFFVGAKSPTADDLTVRAVLPRTVFIGGDLFLNSSGQLQK